MTTHPTTTEAALEPCPFCGGNAILTDKLDEGGRWSVYCRACKSGTGWTTGKEKAVERWNCRIPAPSVAPGVDHSHLDRIQKALDDASEERYQSLREWEQLSERWKSQGDMYGWNFHQGMVAGANYVDIYYHRVAREIKAIRESAAPASPAARRDEAGTGGFTCDCCGRDMEVRINGKFCNECARYRAATPRSGLAQAAAEKIADWLNWKHDIHPAAHEQNIVSIAAIIERCLSGGGEQSE